MRGYRDRFWEYIKSEDQKDRDSLHIYYLREGVSDKPANFENAPRFMESFNLTRSLQDAILDVAMLTLFAVLFFMAAYVSFIRTDVR